MFVFETYAQNNFRISFSYDLKMKKLGPCETSETGQWNFLFRFAYGHNHQYYHAFLENFNLYVNGSARVGVNCFF